MGKALKRIKSWFETSESRTQKNVYNKKMYHELINYNHGMDEYELQKIDDVDLKKVDKRVKEMNKKRINDYKNIVYQNHGAIGSGNINNNNEEIEKFSNDVKFEENVSYTI